ncbi:MAG: L-serine ammonia-lyase, iron-sulfur-dependent, subunit alpha [Rhodospirillales bacterium]|jgi:L-cysteine desulfidase|nr:L-serine ammonia-lyase, iron-sulfur-dependent, subunit alpha [Rhodospirillales bacterium]
MLDQTQPVDGVFIVDLLESEIRPAMGCTEIGAAALVAAKAAETLGAIPDRLHLVVSQSIYKNGVAVAIPGTNLKGLAYAGALGALIRQSHLGLNILNFTNRSNEAEAEGLVREGRVTVDVDINARDPVFLRAEVGAGRHTASATVVERHSYIADVRRDGNPIISDMASAPCPQATSPLLRLAAVPVRELISTLMTMETSPFGFLIDAARTNRNAALTDLEADTSTLGPALRNLTLGHTSGNAVVGKVQTMTAAASEARMAGLPVPVYALAGSGNHGITALTGIYEVAGELGADEDRLCRALAVACLLAIYVKAHTGRLTSYCGCAIAPATGVAAATVYLLGGSIEAMVHAMQSVIGTFSGMLCDGAKMSCAYKVSTVAAAAVQFAHLALQNAFVPCGDGIVGRTIEDTIRNLAILNNPGMKETDRIILDLLQGPGRNVAQRPPAADKATPGLPT